MAATTTSRICSIELLGPPGTALPGFMEKEREQAVQNILAGSLFRPRDEEGGPYGVVLSVEDGRLMICLHDAGSSREIGTLGLSLRPYRRLIQDYFLMLDSYEKARLTAGREKLEAIDMGRRGLHNEGADMLKDRLEDKIEMDRETARKLFTLICALHKPHGGQAET